MKDNTFCEKIIVTEEEIDLATTRIADEINRDYHGEEVVFIAILNGAFMFATDLIKKVELDCYVDFMQCSTYGDKTVSSGNFVIKKDLVMDISQKNGIVVEDILDSGYTIKNLLEYLKNKNPKTIKVATFIDKPARRAENVTADSRFMEDLGFTSFDFMSMLGELEDEFDVEIDQQEVTNVRTVGEAVAYLESISE